MMKTLAVIALAAGLSADAQTQYEQALGQEELGWLKQQAVELEYPQLACLLNAADLGVSESLIEMHCGLPDRATSLSHGARMDTYLFPLLDHVMTLGYDANEQLVVAAVDIKLTRRLSHMEGHVGTAIRRLK